MKTKIVKINPEEICDSSFAIDEPGFSSGGSAVNDAAAPLRDAAALLLAGKLVAFPTETVYGLGAAALNDKAVKKIYKVKGRPADNPLILHIENMGQLTLLTDEVSAHAKALAERFWPGPLTMIFIKKGDLPKYVTAGLDTVAVRMPSHPVARALIKASGAPIAAPSANLSGKPSPTSGAHVIDDLTGKISMIIDSGPVTIGLESTVVDLTRVPAVILRPGGVTYEDIADTIGRENVAGNREYVSGQAATDDERPRSPGIKYRHYAPNAPMHLLEGSAENVAFWMRLFATVGKTKAGGVGLLASDEALAMSGTVWPDNITALSLGSIDNPEAAAYVFYDALRTFDKSGVQGIYCEHCRRGGIGTALKDRMARAAASSTIDVDEPTILFVCTGNTCRSAMAELLFNSQVEERMRDAGEHVVAPFATSAGTHAPEGAMATIEAIHAMQKMKLELSGHRSGQLDYWRVARSSLTLTMTQAQRDEVIKRFPAMGARVFTLVEFVSAFGADGNNGADDNYDADGYYAAQGDDIDDPYGYDRNVYEECAERLRGLTAALADILFDGRA